MHSNFAGDQIIMISRTSGFVAEVRSESKERTRNIEDGSICIWMVDDNDNFRSLLAELLGYEEDFSCSRQFPSAEAVLETLSRENPPDVILLDIQMRGQSGLDAVRPIITLAPSTIVLMLTTFYDSHARVRAMGDGATDLLLKSYTVDEIARRIRQAHDRRGTPLSCPETESAIPDRQNRSVDVLQDEPSTNGAIASVSLEGSCRKSSWRSASRQLARGVTYLRTLLTAGRGSRQATTLPGSLGSAGEIDCISE
jgi:DNA-binding NarL/FixJ family response regulator